jgi:hypothetical protein
MPSKIRARLSSQPGVGRWEGLNPPPPAEREARSDQPSMNDLRRFDREGWRSLRSALASI